MYFTCSLTSITVATTMATSLTYLTGGAATIVSYATYTIVPACGATVSYSYSVNGVANAADPSFTFGTTSFTIS